jgi:hypothetical protein
MLTLKYPTNTHNLAFQRIGNRGGGTTPVLDGKSQARKHDRELNYN